MAIEQLTPARVVQPGRILSRELEARGWTQKQLAEIIDRPEQAISEIIRGTKRITPDTAIELSQAFGTSADFWLNLEVQHQVQRAQDKRAGDDSIVRRKALYELLPLSELLRRNWIAGAESIGELEDQVCDFLGVRSISEPPKTIVQFRQAPARSPEVSAQMAWAKRVEHLASRQVVKSYKPARLVAEISSLLVLAHDAEGVAQVPDWLMDRGVRFVIVPALPSSFVDGAMLVLPPGPVIALTLRYDRIDAFWFTLLHELAHLVIGHKNYHLEQLYDGDTQRLDSQEAEANRKAQDWLIDPKELAAFVEQTKPYFSKAAIRRFSEVVNRHPGIVVGQLQYRGAIPYSHSRDQLVKVGSRLSSWIDKVSNGTS